MSYYPTTPQSNEDPRISQGRFLANFGKINSDFSVNHNQLTSSSNKGFHTKIQFPTGLGANPDLDSPASSLYTKLISGVAQLFFQNGNTSADVFQLTNLTVTDSGTNYSVITPWNIKIQMGVSTSPVTYADPFSAGYTLYFPMVTGFGAIGVAAVSPRITSLTGANNETGFIFTKNSGTTVSYLVMGTP